jgi:hypothetical protein
VAGGGVAYWVVRATVPKPMVWVAPAEFDRAVATLSAHLDVLEERLVAAESHPDATDALTALGTDVNLLRDDVRAQLLLVDETLRLHAERLDQLVEDALRPGGRTVVLDRELTDEERERWAALLAKDTTDIGGRFSALVVLGRHRSDRGVQAALQRVLDPDEHPRVLWQALRNLGKFKERATAVAVARLLDHEELVVRSAANWALLAMGAPDEGFDPVAAAEERAGPAAALREWAELND